jgi:two-component system chemotaxis response regulator CheB
MIRVLIVDDSPTARLALRWGLEREPEILVVGEAASGAEAMAEVRRLDPDLVTLDVLLTDESGLDVAARLMTEHPVPILIVSSTHTTDPSLPFRALEVGAVEATAKLPSREHPRYGELATRLVRVAKAVARTPVLHRRRGRSPQPTARLDGAAAPEPSRELRRDLPTGVVIGGSTGAPPLVAQLLTAIPVPTPVPVLIAQHISPGFAANFASWLAEVTRHDVSVVTRATALASPRVHLAPDDRHLELATSQSLKPVSAAPGDCCPGIDLLFSSAAIHWGAGAIAVLLTGMGRDGAEGLARLGRAGAKTVIQDPATCAVSSMPECAMRAVSSALVLAPDQIASWLSQRPWRGRQLAD